MRLVNYRGIGFGAVITHDGVDRLLRLEGTVEEALADSAVMDRARAAVAHADPAALHELDPELLLAPVRPGTIVCVGYNYRHHVPDGADPSADPEFPDIFLKSPNVLVGPNDPVRMPGVPADVDYEGELAVVIGARASAVSMERALDHVAGYTLFNDVSARDWQRRTSQWTLGKCFDTFGPIGPWIVTADEVSDPHDLIVEVERDGVVTVRQSTSTMIFSIAFLVHYISQVMTLQPGDIISTGTPQKIAHAQSAHRSIAPGDAVTVRIAGIGELATTFTSSLGGAA